MRNGKLRDCEVFLLTDNLVTENVFYKRTSSSETLFNLIFRSRKLELERGIILHMNHVSGKRIIASTVDALLSGDTTKNIIKGDNLLTYFSFHLKADQQSVALVP